MDRFSISKDNWSCLVKVFDQIGKDCTDIDVCNSKIRQTNNSKTIVYLFDLPIENFSIKIALVKNLIPILKMFLPENDSDCVDVELLDNKYVIKDSYSSVTIHSPINIENQYIDDEKFKTIGFEGGSVIFKKTIPELVYNRISVVKNNFSSVVVGLDIQDTAAITISSWSKTMKSTIYSNIEVNNECDDSLRKKYVCSSSAFDIPFEGDVEFIFKNLENGIQVLQLSGTFESYPLTVYVRAMEHDKVVSSGQ